MNRDWSLIGSDGGWTKPWFPIYPDGWVGDPGSEGVWPENDDGD